MTANFKLTPPSRASGGELTATVTVGGRQIRSGMRTIEYGHIPATPVFPRAAMRVERLDVELLAREIGYVMGAGDKIPEALRGLGANVTLLSAEDLAAGDLGRFDAVVTGVRALNTRPDLIAARERVLEYVENGGTLVVQYNTASFRRGGAGGATVHAGAVSDDGVKTARDRRARQGELPSGSGPLLAQLPESHHRG